MEYNKSLEEAIFAMGCFWCSAAAFADQETNVKMPGIVSLTVGYSGGTSENPTYENHEGHLEVLKVVFDPTIISYEQLLNIFWSNIDPFDDQGQFCDKGPSYRSAIFYCNEDQRLQSEDSKMTLEKSFNKTIATFIKPASPFYEAEEYHQDYKIKNPLQYHSYQSHSGREDRLNEIWEPI